MSIHHQPVDRATIDRLARLSGRGQRQWISTHCDRGLDDFRRHVGEIVQLPMRGAVKGCGSPEAPVVFDLEDSPDDELRHAATALVAGYGLPCQVVRRWPLWHTIPVDTDRPSHRFGGVGLNPLHMDMVNASDPPAGIGLLCLRPDPLGGGATLLASVAEVLARLPAESQVSLRELVISEGAFFDYRGVGQALHRFPVFDHGLLRFTAKLPPSAVEEQHRAAYSQLSAAVATAATEVPLARGQLLVFSNLSHLHGRQPLGPHQARLNVLRRRCVNQVYLAQCDRCA